LKKEKIFKKELRRQKTKKKKDANISFKAKIEGFIFQIHQLFTLPNQG